jgi:hypothetical protein
MIDQLHQRRRLALRVGSFVACLSVLAVLAVPSGCATGSDSEQASAQPDAAGANDASDRTLDFLVLGADGAVVLALSSRDVRFAERGSLNDGTPAAVFRLTESAQQALMTATASATGDAPSNVPELHARTRWMGRELAFAPRISSQVALWLAADTGPAGDPEAFTRWALETFPSSRP